MASAADGTGNRLDDIKQFVTTVQDYVLEQKAVPVLLQLRTGDLFERSVLLCGYLYCL